MKKAPGSLLRLAKKYITKLNMVVLINLIGHIEIREEIASIPGWYMAKPCCFCWKTSISRYPDRDSNIYTHHDRPLGILCRDLTECLDYVEENLRGIRRLGDNIGEIEVNNSRQSR